MDFGTHQQLWYFVPVCPFAWVEMRLRQIFSKGWVSLCNRGLVFLTLGWCLGNSFFPRGAHLFGCWKAFGNPSINFHQFMWLAPMYNCLEWQELGWQNPVTHTILSRKSNWDKKNVGCFQNKRPLEEECYLDVNKLHLVWKDKSGFLTMFLHETSLCTLFSKYIMSPRFSWYVIGQSKHPPLWSIQNVFANVRFVSLSPYFGATTITPRFLI